MQVQHGPCHKLTLVRTSPRFNHEKEMPIGIGRRHYHNLLVVVRERMVLRTGQTTEMFDRGGRSAAPDRWRRDGRRGKTGVVEKQPRPTLRSAATAGGIVKREGQLQCVAAIRVTAGGRSHGAAPKAEERRGSLQREEGSSINDHGWLLNN